MSKSDPLADLGPFPPAPTHETRMIGLHHIPTSHRVVEPARATLPDGTVIELPAGTVIEVVTREAREPTASPPDRFGCVCHIDPGKCQVIGHEPP